MLDKLTAKDLDAWYADLTRTGTSEAQVMQYHRIISAALRQAEKWGMVPSSVARNASPPRLPVKRMKVPPPERVVQLIDAAAATRNPELSIFIMAAALTGLRRGEMCGVQWADIDWQGSALTVNRSIYQTKGGKWAGKDPKTHQVRRVELGPRTMETLRFQRQRVADNARDAGITLPDDAYVFSNAVDGGRPWMPDTVTQAFTRLCERIEEQHRRTSPGRIVWTISATTRPRSCSGTATAPVRWPTVSGTQIRR